VPRAFARQICLDELSSSPLTLQKRTSERTWKRTSEPLNLSLSLYTRSFPLIYDSLMSLVLIAFSGVLSRLADNRNCREPTHCYGPAPGAPPTVFPFSAACSILRSYRSPYFSIPPDSLTFLFPRLFIPLLLPSFIFCGA